MMDIADINKVTTRKRLNEDAEKLRERVSRETAKIIKLKVAQDTAYWDLKEKLHQLENNHERLQQNMAEVQTQHEAVSGQLEDELRQRPETLNKLNSTRQICDVLEEYSERLKSTLSRCKTDQATLCEAYQKSGQLVKDMKTKQAQQDERNQAIIQSLEEKFKLATENQNQLIQFFNSSKQQADEEIRELKTKLNTAQSQKDELLKIANDMARDLDGRKHEIDARDKNIASLQSEMKRLSCTINKQEKELKDSSASIEALRTALTNQENFAKSLVEQNNALQEQISSLEEAAGRSQDEVELMRSKLQDVTITCDALQKDVTSLVQAKDSLEMAVEQKNQMLAAASTEIDTLKSQLNNVENEKTCALAELSKLAAECEGQREDIERLEGAVRGCGGEIEGLKRELEETRASNEETIANLNQTINTKTTENKSKSETITKLMNDIANCLEERSRLELSIERIKKDIELERARRDERENKMAQQIEKLDGSVREKDQEIKKQINMILEIRSEKEKLQEQMTSMQNTIDNARKELAGRPRDPAPALSQPPELDDNACTSPVKKIRYFHPPKSPILLSTPTPTQLPPRPQKVSEFAIPRHEPRLEIRPAPRRERAESNDKVFGLLSDSSLDGDAVDPNEINRRFEALARGEALPRAPLSALKRRREHRARQHEQIVDQQISLSQLRAEMQVKENTFFKTKRPGEAKMKRRKRPDDNDKQNA